MVKMSSIFRYGLMKRLRRGDSLLMYITFRCTLKCPYCSLKYIDGKYPESEELTLTDWKRTIKSFPRKIREVKISGGEPMLMPYFAELVNWLTDEGYFVFILTNMTVRRTDIKPSNKLMFCATYHQGYSTGTWLWNYKYYLSRYRVVAHQLKSESLEFLPVAELCYREYGDTCAGFLYGPDGKLFTIANQLYEAYT